MGTWLRERLPEHVDVAGMLRADRFVYDDGTPVRDDDLYRSHTFIWFHRDRRDEPAVPGRIHIVARDERIVVVDKPPFLATIPRGRHVLQSVVVKLRQQLGLAELSPAHRLDRVTSGLLVLTTERRWRGTYQELFAERQVTKTYQALARHDPDLEFPMLVRNHLRKRRGSWQVEVDPDAPFNAETRVELEEAQGGIGRYRLTPLTGRTHQLRAHLCGLGIPIVDDPLYPVVRDIDVDDFSHPLQLLASELAFTDPIDGSTRRFRTVRELPLAPPP